MISKKAQSELITTVLIILLVLAAIVIVWQVVNGIIKKGGDAVTAKSECLEFQMEITVPSLSVINIRPSKAVTDSKIYINGEEALCELSTNPIDEIPVDSINESPTYPIGAMETRKCIAEFEANSEITAAGKIGEQWCEGLNKVKASA